MGARFNPDNASPSRYANFLDCPMKFWIFNLHPHREEFRNKGKSLGQVVDQTLHRFFMREPDNRTLESLKADFDLVWTMEKDNTREWCILPREEESCKQDAWQILAAFFQDFDITKTPVYIPPLSNNPAKFDALIKLELAPDLVIRGWGDRVDQTTDGYEVVDYKTKTGAELYEEKNNLQLRMYGLLFDEWLGRRGLDGQISSLAFIYLTPKGVETRRFSFTATDREDTKEEIRNLQREVKKMWTELKDNPWPCQCGHCDKLLAAMEARADEWAQAINEPTKAVPTADIPF